MSKAELPPEAVEFLRTPMARWHEPIVQQFHRWMKRRGITLATLEPRHLERFLERPPGKPTGGPIRLHYRYMVREYLEWLSAHEILSFDPRPCFRARPHKRRKHQKQSKPPRPYVKAQEVLPPDALRFLEALSATLKSSTCRVYKNTLGRFHRWLTENQLSLHALSRQQIEGYFTSLYQRGLHPSTRLHTIIMLRAYMRWLYEQGDISHDPDDLIRRTDLPKLPTYLPRPLPPQADHQLRARLARSRCRYRLGLLLMRNTGLRIGELRSLPLDCLRTDQQHNAFLKVPLGKLDTERLVPLDDKTVKLVKKLRRTGSRRRQWLLATPGGKQTGNVDYNRILRDVCRGLDIPDPITTHRLRHTYATSLLSGGMSLLGVMKCLGHRDFRMTLRYTAITQQTVRKEYDEALSVLQKRYRLEATTSSSNPDLLKILSDIERRLRKAYSADAARWREAQLLIRRVRRIRNDIKKLE